MSSVTAEEVRVFLAERYSAPLASVGIDIGELSDDLDLMSEGIIDSLGIIELLSALESEFEIQIDFEDLDPEYLVVVGPFCRYVAEKSESSS
jgi:acyl carrier protein